jgi:DNA-binding transcriptional ArsR family regulator
LALLKSEERSAGELVAQTGASNSVVSQHLSVLLNAGLVHQRKAGKQRIYWIEPKPLEEVRDFMAEFSKFWDDKLEALGRYLEEME